MPSYQKPLRPAAKPALKPEVIQSAMDKRPRLNANTRRAAAPGVAPKPGAGTPGEPAWMALQRAGVAGTGSAAGNRAAAAGLQGSPRVAPPPPPPGGMRRAPGAEIVDTMSTMPAEMEPMLMAGGGLGAPPPEVLASLRAGAQGSPPQGAPPSGSQNPMFSANLPPEIMARLQALQGMRAGGGQGAPGVAGAAPGAPAASPPPALPDYYASPRFGGGQGFQPSFDRRMAY